MSKRRRWLLLTILGVALLAIAAEWLVPAAVGALHRGTGISVLDRILEGRSVHPLEHYVTWARSLSREVLAALAVLWALAAIASHPAVAAPLAARLSRSPRARAAPEPVLPSSARRRLVAALAGVITGGSLLELGLDPPYRGEHWPFSQYQMYSELPGPLVTVRRLYGVDASGREVSLQEGAYARPFDHSRLWFSWNRLDASPERQRLVPLALRDCLERYEARRREGRHDGPRLEAVRLYRMWWTPGAPSSVRDGPERELLWEVRASSLPSPSP